MIKERLHDLIRNIIDDSSGGLKFTELLSKILIAYHEGEISFEESDLNNLSELIEACIDQSNDMKILEYSCVPMKRQKMFVYTP